MPAAVSSASVALKKIAMMKDVWVSRSKRERAMQATHVRLILPIRDCFLRLGTQCRACGRARLFGGHF